MTIVVVHYLRAQGREVLFDEGRICVPARVALALGHGLRVGEHLRREGVGRKGGNAGGAAQRQRGVTVLVAEETI